MKQRDTQWRQARLGDVTASRFGDLLTDASPAGLFSVQGERGAWRVIQEGLAVTGDFTKKADAEERKAELVAEWRKTHWSQTAESYLDEKLSELIHCQPADKWRSDPTDWGTVNEPLAFEAAVDAVKERFGGDVSMPVDDFAYIHHSTEPHIGCSPDGIIGDDGLLELKAPWNPAKWIRAYRYGLEVPKEYVAQLQGSLWVTGRQWYAFGYYDPRVRASGLDPLLMIRVERDEAYINEVLAPRVLAFRDYLRSEYERIVGEQGPF